jgi:hypothetical protein
MDTDEKAYEEKLRRLAEQQDLTFVKSRVTETDREPRYGLLDHVIGIWVFAVDHHTLEEIGKYLEDRAAALGLRA